MNGFHGSHKGIARPKAVLHDYIQVLRADDLGGHLERSTKDVVLK